MKIKNDQENKNFRNKFRKKFEEFQHAEEIKIFLCAALFTQLIMRHVIIQLIGKQVIN